MKIITITLHTLQPLLATSFQGDPNSDVSYSYIPGSMIRGAIIGRYIKHNGLSELNLDNDEIRRLFFDANSTQFLNAYLLSNEGQRTLPIPRSWFKEKGVELDNRLDNDSPITVFDLAIDKTDDLTSPKFVGEGFWINKGGIVNFYKENRRINIHNRRDRKQGRSTQIKRDAKTNQLQGEGEIFRYEAIDSGQNFQTSIICSTDADAKLLKNLFDESKDIWFGGSQTAGYGHTKITKIICDIEKDNWDEVYICADDRTDRDFFTITLLSDLILRDEWGQYSIIPPSPNDKTPTPITREIEKFLDVDVKLKPIVSYTNSTKVGGFNRKWGLPLPQVAAFTAGSVFVFKKIKITSEKIKQIEAKGIGERRNEGFGRLAINLLEKSDYYMSLPDKKNKEKPQLKKDYSYTLAVDIAEKLLNNKIEQALQKYIGRINIQGNISNSQLSRLLLVARQALSSNNCDLVLSLLNNLTTNAENQFDQAKIEPSNAKYSLKQQLYEWLNKADDWIWVSNKQNLTVNVANIERSIADEHAIQKKLAQKYTLRLIMALAKKAMKEKKQ